MEERLPELFEKVLVYTKREGVEVSWYTDVVYLEQRWKTGEISYWMPLPEPPKQKLPTFKDVFLKAFPKAQKYDEGTPIACAEDVFPQVKRHDHCDGRCDKCWNLPYFEEEGEAE